MTMTETTESAGQTLFALLSQPWRAEAACTGMDTEIWFPVKRPGMPAVQYTDARPICESCPVREQCLEFALMTEDSGFRSGMFGGMTPDERYKEASRRYKAATGNRLPKKERPLPTTPMPDSHGTRYCYDRERMIGETCAVCREGERVRGEAKRNKARAKERERINPQAWRQRATRA